MFTTYTPVQTLAKSANLIGGICKWWYSPIDNLNPFPELNPANGQLLAEPTLKAGAVWFGPVRVMDSKLGYDESQEKNTAGPFYKRKVQGFVQGSSIKTHIDTGVMPNYQFCVIAKVRTGGYYVLGNNLVGMDFDHGSNTGLGGEALPGHSITFADECRHKALILSTFSFDI